MSVELIRKQVDFNEMTKKESVQVVKERDMIVPDGKPDMQRVLYLDGQINIDQIDVQEDRVVYKGQLDTTILYAAENGSKEVYAMRGSVPLEDFVILDGVDPSQRVAFNYNIEHLHWNILNERKLNVKAVLQIGVEATKSKEVALVTDVKNDGPIQTRSDNLMFVKPSGFGLERLVVKDELTIPQGKGSVAEILKMNTTVKEEQIKRTDSEIIYNGIIEVVTLYKSQDEEKPIEVAKHRIPFTGSADVAKASDELYCQVELNAKPTYMQVTPDHDGEDRVVEVECTVEAKYNTFEKCEEKIIGDVYCPGKKLTLSNTKENYMTLASRNVAKTAKKEMIALESPAPDLEQVFSVTLKPIIDEKQIQNDKLTINGVLEAKVVYIEPDAHNMIQTAVDMLPFSQEVSVEGLSKDAYLDIKVIPKDIEVGFYNRNDLMVEYTLDYIVNVYNKGSVETIKELDVHEMTKEELNDYPSITVYAVRKGDSLWDLAKRYNTTVKEIMEINDLQENSPVNQGQKLIILKKTKF